LLWSFGLGVGGLSVSPRPPCFSFVFRPAFFFDCFFLNLSACVFCNFTHVPRLHNCLPPRFCNFFLLNLVFLPRRPCFVDAASYLRWSLFLSPTTQRSLSLSTPLLAGTVVRPSSAFCFFYGIRVFCLACFGLLSNCFSVVFVQPKFFPY